MAGLSTLSAEGGELMKAIGQAAAARELANSPLALQQVGLLRMRMGLDTDAPVSGVHGTRGAPWSPQEPSVALRSSPRAPMSS